MFGRTVPPACRARRSGLRVRCSPGRSELRAGATTVAGARGLTGDTSRWCRQDSVARARQSMPLSDGRLSSRSAASDSMRRARRRSIAGGLVRDCRHVTRRDDARPAWCNAGAWITTRRMSGAARIQPNLPTRGRAHGVGRSVPGRRESAVVHCGRRQPAQRDDAVDFRIGVASGAGVRGQPCRPARPEHESAGGLPPRHA